jgi:hypothetical protein
MELSPISEVHLLNKATDEYREGISMRLAADKRGAPN